MLIRSRSLLFAVLVLAGTPAFAHSHPKIMVPAANAIVASPSELSVVFTEALEPKFSKLELTDEKGTVLSKQPSVVDPADHKHITLPVPKLAAGQYRVHWVSAAADGHHMDGDYTFTVK